MPLNAERNLDAATYVGGSDLGWRVSAELCPSPNVQPGWPELLAEGGETMSKLTTGKRDKLPEKEFALPGHRYPVEDKNHARNAKARAAQQERAGRLSPADKAKIDRKADAVLKK